MAVFELNSSACEFVYSSPTKIKMKLNDWLHSSGFSISALEENTIISYGNHVIFIDRTGSYNGLDDNFISVS